MGKLTEAGKKLVFWQSKSFYELTRGPRGEPVERELGTTRPKDLTFVKGGKKRALEEAEGLWGKFKAKVTGELDSEQGEKPWEGEPLEPEERPALSEKPARISEPRGTISGRRDVRITAPTMGRHGLDS